ncbi:retrovirus-related Pol polyprotein from transposon 17.6 [Trichonephila clavipes]|nr:retrovirus-related Pol polyprotein from transposon 17.6 [Trichonephila clavipes]
MRAGRFRKRRGESQSFLFRDADQESKTRMRNNALRTGPRQAVEQAKKEKVAEDRWVSQLIPLLPIEIAEIVAKEPLEKSDDYPHIKNLLLARFQLTPIALRDRFESHQRRPGAMWADSVFELRSYLDNWLAGMKVDDFAALKELLVTEQIKKRAPSELVDHFLDSPELVSLVVEEVSDDIEGDAEIPYPDKQCTKFDYHEILRESQLQLKLSPSQIDELKQVITKNKDVFSPDPGTTHLMRIDIELISEKPIKTKPYRMSPRQINTLREEIKLESPNKDPRPCVDYRRLNEITQAEFFPLPNMEEVVEKVSAAPYVTVMDLSKGYFQIPLTPTAQR